MSESFQQIEASGLAEQAFQLTFFHLRRSAQAKPFEKSMTVESKKSVSLSRITLHHLMTPEHANALGNVHGGVIMRLVDETGAICAMRHARRPCVTIAIDSMTFREPVHVGALLVCEARVSYVGRTSIETSVRVHSENPITGETTHTNSAYVVYVALGNDGRPTAVPGLELETEEDRKLFAEGIERQKHRLAHTG